MNEMKNRITATDGLACPGRGAGRTGIQSLTQHVKTRPTSNEITYQKERIDEMVGRMIHEYSSLPPIHCFEYCLKEARSATETPNHPVHRSWDLALGNKRVTMALGSSGGPLMTTQLPVIETV
jgi:hypothetical protein